MDPNKEDAPGAESQSLSDQLRASFEQHESEVDDGEEILEDESASVEEEAGEAEAPAEGEGEAESGDVPPAEDSGSPKQADKDVEGEEAVPPPVGWKAGVREHWKDLPKDVKEYIHQREREFHQGIQRSSEMAQYAQRLNQAIEPMRPFFRANGLDDERGLQSVMQTAGMLMGGSGPQKVQAVTNLIQQYGIDLQMLDQSLAQVYGAAPSGEQGQQDPTANPQFKQMLEQELAPFRQFMGQLSQATQRRQQQDSQRYLGEVQQFAQSPENEFYYDVRADMADLLDLAANRGVNMTMQEAYERACYANPEIRQVLEQRKQREAASERAVQNSSVAGSPEGLDDMPDPDDLHGTIAHAWNQHAKRAR